MRAFTTFASVSVIFLAAGCSGFTELGEGAGKAGMAGTAGDAGSGSSGKGGKGGSSSGGTGTTGGTNATGGSSTGGTNATGGTSTGGSTTGGTNATGGSGGTGGGYVPCAGKACGATCTQCAPDDPDCAEDAVINYCDASGHCAPAFPVCEQECETRDDCGILDIACAPCADGFSACPTVDCVGGKCVNTFPTCPSECKEDGDCPVSKAPCQLCADGTSACPWARCEGGQCTSGIDSCENTDPCADKACGDYCSTCTPDLPCIAVAMYCDQNLKCQLNQPVCSEAECKENADCNTDICGLCPNSGGCAAQVCVDGQCTFECPEDACGGCESGEICMYQVGGPGPSHYACAKQSQCDAASECLCILDQGTCQFEKVDGYCQCDNGLE